MWFVTTAQSVSACRCGRLRTRAGAGAGAALAWSVRARSSRWAAAAAHSALRAYRAGAPLPASDLLLTAGAALLLDDTLLFLGEFIPVLM